MSRDRLSTFTDLVPILDQALTHGGGTYTLPDHGKAVNFRHRCYKFRKVYAEKFPGDPRYDVLVFPRLNTDTCDVVIEIGRPMGVFTPAGPATTGIFNPAPSVAGDPTDDLLATAMELNKKHGIGDAL